jgi:citrate lyase subunit beta/citryl-CoA lyase
MGALEHQIDAKESELSVLKNEGLQRKQDIAQQDGQIMALREEEQELELEIQHNKAMDLLRTVLSVPGNVEKMIEKSKQLKVDAVVLDLEDSVPAEEKSRARMIVRDAIPALTGTCKKIYVRINPWESGLAKDDMEAVIVKGLDGISQPKPSSAKDIAEVDAFIGKLEKERGIPQNHIKILPWIETAKGMLNAYEIASASSRVIAIIFGANDFVLETGMIRSESENDLVYPRTKIVIASRAAGVLAIDTPFNDFKDEVGLIKEAYLARRLGFDGKLVIHPDQVDTVNRIFLPTENDVAHAVKVLEAFQSARLKGFASTSLDGRMIDIPIAQRALKVMLSWTASLGLDTKS